MFIEFIETGINKLPYVETRKFVDVGTSFYRWQQVATNGDAAVIQYMLAGQDRQIEMAIRNRRSMRPDEELCCRALEALLRDRGLDATCMQGPNPPDGILTLAGRRFAVEITSIHGVTNFARRDFKWIQIEKELLSFGASVCAEVEAKTEVPGCFMISFPPLPRINHLRSGVVAALVQYFQTSFGGRSSSRTAVVFRSEGKEVSVWKVKDEGSALIAQALPTGSLVGPRANQLENLLLGAVQAKRHKLRGIADAKILVIHDQYLFQRTSEEWRTCLSDRICPFQAVVRVQRGMAELICGTLPTS